MPAAGAEAAAKAVPDGYTLFFTGGSTMALQPLVFAGKLPFDPLADFAPVSMVSHFPFFVLVPASLQVNTLAEFVAYVKARPGQVSYASNGSGLISHLGMEMLKQATGMDLLHVPYKGFAPALPDLLSGRVAVMMADLAPVGQQLRAGSLRALAATSAQRSGFLPEVPTVAELGNPGYEIGVWFGLFAPARVPARIVEKLQVEANRAIHAPEIERRLQAEGADVIGNPSKEFDAQVKAEYEKWRSLVQKAGLKVQ